jgi:hypothetical protein
VIEPGWCGRRISASSDNGVHGFEVRVWGLEAIRRRWFRGGRVGAAVSTTVGGGVAVRVPPRPRAAGGAGGSGLPEGGGVDTVGGGGGHVVETRSGMAVRKTMLVVAAPRDRSLCNAYATSLLYEVHVSTHTKLIIINTSFLASSTLRFPTKRNLLPDPTVVHGINWTRLQIANA